MQNNRYLNSFTFSKHLPWNLFWPGLSSWTLPCASHPGPLARADSMVISPACWLTHILPGWEGTLVRVSSLWTVCRWGQNIRQIKPTNKYLVMTQKLETGKKKLSEEKNTAAFFLANFETAFVLLKHRCRKLCSLWSKYTQLEMKVSGWVSEKVRAPEMITSLSRWWYPPHGLEDIPLVFQVWGQAFHRLRHTKWLTKLSCSW